MIPILKNEMHEKALGVVALDFGAQEAATNYYRVEVPLRGLNAAGLAYPWRDRGFGDREAAMQSTLNSDIILAYAMSGDKMPGMFETIKKMKSGLDQDGNRIFPPSLIYDIDDNLDYIHPFNSVFVHMGTRDGDGNLLNPGDNITTVMPDGKEYLVWLDGVTRGDDGIIFDVKRNRKYVNSCHALAKLCHGVTVPSPALADYYREVHGHKNVYVFPNTVIQDDYFFPRLAPREDDTVRILWQGGSSHMPDWYPLRDALKEVAQKYPKAKFVVWGQKFDWIHNVIPEEQLEFHYWVQYPAYKLKRTLLDIDINLCPLADNIFNRCKSAIKWYEGSIGPRPEATLAAGVPPYSDEIKDGETGLLYHSPTEFAQKLGKLIEDEQLRKKLGEGAREWVTANRTPEATIPGLNEFYKEMRREREYEFHRSVITA